MQKVETYQERVVWGTHEEEDLGELIEIEIVVGNLLALPRDEGPSETGGVSDEVQDVVESALGSRVRRANLEDPEPKL